MLGADDETVLEIVAVKTIADVLAQSKEVTAAMESLEMQPTSGAFLLAAQAALAVLTAHELGQANKAKE